MNKENQNTSSLMKEIYFLTFKIKILISSMNTKSLYPISKYFSHYIETKK